MVKRKNIHFILFLSALFLHTPTAIYSTTDCKDESNLSFREIFFNNKLNASDKWENYLEVYDDAFQKFIGQSPNVIEIGVQNGGNLQIMQQYFKNANVYGIDIDTNVCKMDLGKNIKTFCFSATDAKRVEESFKNIQFDVILDDGSHINPEIIETFNIFFRKLKPSGVYLIEDLHTSYWANVSVGDKKDYFEGGYLRKGSAIEFLKKFVDLVNFYHIKDPEFLKNLSDNDRYVFEWLESITFYDSIVVIKKLKQPRKEPYKRFVTGKFQPIVPSIDIAKQDGYYVN